MPTKGLSERLAHNEGITYRNLYIYIAHFGTDEGRSTFLFRPKYLLFKFLI